jgi:hypothetical protein
MINSNNMNDDNKPKEKRQKHIHKTKSIKPNLETIIYKQKASKIKKKLSNIKTESLQKYLRGHKNKTKFCVHIHNILQTQCAKK